MTTRATTSKPKGKRRPRKSTFVVRKEEKQSLEREIARLQHQLLALHQLPTSANANSINITNTSNDTNTPTIPTTSTRRALRDRHITLHGLCSLLSAYMAAPRVHLPLSPICLPLDAKARRAMLVQRSVSSISDLRDLVLERSLFLDLSRAHLASEWFEHDDDSMCLVQFDVTPFCSLNCSIRDVYDAVGFYSQNVEILVSERLGDLTIREDDDVVDTVATGARVSQRRVVSTTNHGLTIDGNVALFRQHFTPGECAVLPQEHAIFCTQSVESDELYPYVPEQRVRHGLDGGCVIQQVENKRGEVVTTMARVSVITRHSSGGRHPIAELNRAPLRTLAMQWGDLMMLAVGEYLHARAGSSTVASGENRTHL